MSAVLKVKVAELDDNFIDRLKREFAKSDLEIRVIDQGESPPSFTEESFWDLLAQLDWSKEGRDTEVIEPVVKALEQQPLAHTYRFADILSEKLWQLDTREHAQVFLEDPEAEGYLSSDDFLYARCAVVANGKAYYDKVLKEPSTMPADLTFESLLSIAPLAYQRKSGKQLMAPPAFNYETYSNKEGWTD